jgi:hypothetical protein
MADINSQILEALNQGMGPQDIIDHLSTSQNPEHRAWVANYKTNLVASNQQPTTETVTSETPTAVQSLGSVANQAASAYANASPVTQVAIPAAALAVPYLAKQGIDIGAQSLKDRSKARTELQLQKSLNELPPSPAIQVQQGQLALQQQAALNAQQNLASPTIDHLVEARIATEQQRAKTEAEKTQLASAQREIAQQKLILSQKKLQIDKTNPAVQAATAKQTAINEPIIPTGAPQAVAPSVDTLATDVTKTPAEKAIGMTNPETPLVSEKPSTIPTETTLVEPVVQPTQTPESIAKNLTAKNNITGEVGASVISEGMRTNPKTNKIKGEVIGRGAYNWIAGQEGANAPKVWEGMIGSKNVPYDPKTFPQQYAEYKSSLMSGGEPGGFPDVTGQVTQKGGAYPRPKFIPEYIKGAASPSALAVTAGLATIPALASAGYQAYQGNKEAVTSNLKDAWESLKSVATLPYDIVKSANKGDFAPLKDLLMNMNPASALINEANKHDQEILKKMIYQEKIGSGRGMQGVPPPNR